MNRRNARRLQNILVFLCLVVSVALMTLPVRWTQPGRTVLLSGIAPIELGLSAAFDALAILPERLRDSSHLLDKNTALSARVIELETERDFLKTRCTEEENLIEQLTDLKRVLPDVGYQLLPAQIVSKERVRTLSGLMRSFTLGCGVSSGVRNDDLVVVGYAVVGKVTAVSPSASTVRVLTDPDFRIAARTIPSGVEALLVGYGENRCLLNYVESRAPVKTGDYVVTSGFEGLHPPELLLGTVENVAQTASGRLLYVEVKPAVNLDRVSQVIVVRRRPAPG